MRRLLAKLALGAYPLAHRRRYGAEMEALIDDSPPRLRGTADLLRGALGAHLRPASTAVLDPGERARASAVGVLGSWILFAIAGLGFYKTTEDPSFSAAASSHLGLGISHGAVQAVAVVASLTVLIAAAPLVLGTVRLARTDREARRATLLAVAAVATFAITTAGLDAVVHPLASLSDGAGAAILCVWAAIGAGCSAACWFAARRGILALRLDRRALTRTLALGTAVTVAMGAMTAATAVYGIALAVDGAGLGSEANGPLGLLSVSISVWIQLTTMLLASALATVSVQRGWRSHQTIR